MTTTQIGLSVLGLLVYLVLGIFGVCMSEEMDDEKAIAIVLFWPALLLLTATRGFRKFLQSGEDT